MLSRIKHSAAYVAYKDWRTALIRRLELPQYLGSQYRCPVCETALARFKPIGRSFLRNFQDAGSPYSVASYETLNVAAYNCPSCDASDRERLIALYLDEVFRSVDRKRTFRLLEFAPSNALRERLRAYPFIDYRDADLHRRTVQDRVDITDMSIYPDASVDIFVCSHVLEHVPDDRRAMRELFRVLKPGGFGIVLVPIVLGKDDTHEDPAINSERLRWKHYGSGDHIRQYGRRDLIDRLSAAGFEVEPVGAERFPPNAFERAGIAGSSTLYLVRKG